MSFRSKKKFKSGKKNSKIQGTISSKVKTQFKSNLDEDFGNQEKMNDDLMGSLIEMQKELEIERSSQMQSKSRMSKTNSKINNSRQSKMQSLFKKKQNEFEVIEENDFEDEQEESQLIQSVPDVIFLTKQKQNLLDRQKVFGDKKYFDDKELQIIVITLKKVLSHQIQTNEKLKQNQKELKKQSEKILKKTEDVQQKIFDLKRLERIEDNVVHNIYYDTDALDAKLNSINHQIEEQIGSSSLSKFIETTLDNKKQLNDNMNLNVKNLATFKRKFDVLSKALIRLNSQQLNFLKLKKKISKQIVKEQIINQMQRGQSRGGSKMTNVQFQTESTGAIKLQPKTVLVMNLAFIGAVVVMHFLDKIKFS